MANVISYLLIYDVARFNQSSHLVEAEKRGYSKNLVSKPRVNNIDAKLQVRQ